ncbi:MAG: HAD family hydrolase [Chloroflexi bacterium]|nr:MAG: HAD family hydrolase [Chloroflexota bacterium]
MLAMIAFDADDTLWQNESAYQLAESKLAALLAGYGIGGDMSAAIYQTEKTNLPYFGFGIKSFTLSMIETAIRLTEGRIGGGDINAIINIAKAMIDAPIELLGGVLETVEQLAQSHPLMLITKGDLLDQERKLERSGLAKHFTAVEIVSDKSADTYRSILTKTDIAPEQFMMIGNSLKSDILPVVEIGGHGVYIPHQTTWIHEVVEGTNGAVYTTLEHIGQLPDFVRKLEQQEAR